MYLIEGNELSLQKLGKILAEFQTKDLPKLKKLKNYYDGKQAIMFKQATDEGKPCNKIMSNYCKEIVGVYSGYLTGLPINYSNLSESIVDVLKYNDVKTEDTDWLTDALIYGVAYEINYIDADGQQRFKLLDPRQTLAIYDNTLDNTLRYVVRFWAEELVDKNDTSYIVEVYSDDSIFRYRSNSGFSSFDLIDEQPNYYNQVPVTVFNLNRENESIFAQIMGMQDAVNSLYSAQLDGVDSLVDSFLLLKGVTADEDDLASMKQHRVLMMDSDASAEYLIKNTSGTDINSMIDYLAKEIYKKTNTPDFADENFRAQSGVAMKYKLIGFENIAGSIESHMKKALQKRLELICSILNIKGDDSEWRDAEIVITRNIPSDISDTVNMVNSLRGLVSDETLLGQISFVTDVDAEMERVKEQNKLNADLYSFGVDD